MRGATVVLLLWGLLSVHICEAEQAESRLIFEHYTHYQKRQEFELINAVARAKLNYKYLQPFIGGSYEDYNAEINSYSMAAGLVGADIPLFHNKVHVRYEFKAPNSSRYEQSSKFGFYTGHYQSLGHNLVFDSYAEFFQVITPTTSYNAAAAWAQIQKTSFIGIDALKPHVEIYYKDSLFENTMQPLKEVRIGLWYQFVGHGLVAKVRGFAFSDVYNKQGLAGEFVMGGTF